jgi:hypothetical protein
MTVVRLWACRLLSSLVEEQESVALTMTLLQRSPMYLRLPSVPAGAWVEEREWALKWPVL